MYPEKWIGGVLGGDTDGRDDSWGDECVCGMLDVGGEEVRQKHVSVDDADTDLRRS